MGDYRYLREYLGKPISNEEPVREPVDWKGVRDTALNMVTTENSPAEKIAQAAFPDFKSTNPAGIYADHPDMEGMALNMAGPIKVVGSSGMRLFHGGPAPITKVDPAKMNTARPTISGKGFYSSEYPEMALRYARMSAFDDGRAVLNSFDLPQGSRVFETAHQMSKADPADVAAVQKHTEALGLDRSPDVPDYWTWPEDVNRYARDNGIDAINMPDIGESVVLNTEALQPVKQSPIPRPKRGMVHPTVPQMKARAERRLPALETLLKGDK